MPRCVPVVLLSFLIVIHAASPAEAQTPQPAAPHLRVEAADVRQLLQELIDRSPTARSLVERLERSDLIVYLRVQLFTTNELDGRVGLLAAVPQHRYLAIEVACGRSRLVQMITLAHELHHAVEIADAPTIVDARSLSAYYSRIGIRIGDGPRSETFETGAARETAAQARRELLGGTGRTTHERD
jgi:hypothetical protein